MNLSDFWSWIAGDLTTEEGRVVRKAGLVVIWRVIFIVFLCFSMGWLSFIGLSGFARASEIDDKISKAVNPLAASVAQLASAVQSQSDAAREQTLALLRVAITDGLVKKCHAPKEETKAIYRHQVDEAQARYYKLTGSYYPEHSCSDL